MDHIAAVEERMASDRLHRKLKDMNIAAETHLTPITDHVNFTMQQAYFKCAYECFDRRRNQQEISTCVENCSFPVMQANNVVEAEMAKFQERMNRSMMVCQDKFEAAKLQQQKTGAMTELESCVDQAIQESVQLLPHIVDKLKASLSINGRT